MRHESSFQLHRGALRARMNPHVRVRPESFGAMTYVPDIDRFLALDHAYSGLLRRTAQAWVTLVDADAHRASHLAESGLVATEPAMSLNLSARSSLVGSFGQLPNPGLPLVINCFAAAHCPLQCVYCHSDDLMRRCGTSDDGIGLERVAAVAKHAPAMTAVITGGEPLYEPRRVEHLIRELALEKALVLDTSGVGYLDALLPALVDCVVHVRVSLDSADPAANDRIRPINRRHRNKGVSSYEEAHRTLRRLQDNGIPCSVQTVVGPHNASFEQLIELREHLIREQVTNWILHVAVPAGNADGRPRLVLNDAEVPSLLSTLVDATESDGRPIGIRVTATSRRPNAVLLDNSLGELCVDQPGGAGRVISVARSGIPSRRQLTKAIGAHVDMREHSRRYLNGGRDALDDLLQVAQESPS